MHTGNDITKLVRGKKFPACYQSKWAFYASERSSFIVHDKLTIFRLSLSRLTLSLIAHTNELL
jgi:hypothetical protein